MGKTDRLIYAMPVEHHNWDHYVSPRCGYSGTEADPEATVSFGFSITCDENVMEEPHMHDARDEYFFFTGADLEHFFESFDAEVEVWLGDDPRHMEKITVTEPGIIRVPPRLWHCPVNFKRVGKPVNFMPMYPDGTFSRISRQFLKGDGTATYVYDAVGLRKCRNAPEKTCNYCGKCFSEAKK